MKTIKTQKGLEITINMETIYNQVWSNKELLTKKDIINIINELQLPVKINKTKNDLIDSLIGAIYQSNYLDSLSHGYSNNNF